MTIYIQPTDLQSETATLNYHEFVGDTIKFQISHQAENGVHTDFTGATLFFEIRANPTDIIPLLQFSNAAGYAGLITTAVPVPNPLPDPKTFFANVSWSVTDSQTTTLGPGTFSYFLEVTDTAGHVETLLNGKIILSVR